MINLFNLAFHVIFLILNVPRNLNNSQAMAAKPYHLPYLNDLLTPFSQCLIHLINYKHLNIPEPRLPIVVEGYHLKNSGQERFLLLEENLTRRQIDSFRWKCVFHGFMFPEMSKSSSKFKCTAYYKEYWTGAISEDASSNLFRHRDYYIYFTNVKSVRDWPRWARGIESALDFEGTYMYDKTIPYTAKIWFGNKFLPDWWHFVPE